MRKLVRSAFTKHTGFSAKESRSVHGSWTDGQTTYYFSPRSKTRMALFTLPPGYRRIKVVDSFEELVRTPFDGGLNALCWQRTLAGNFTEVVQQLGASEGM